MMKYEYNSTLLPNRETWVKAIAEDYVYAGGVNSDEIVREIFAKHYDNELAIECIEDWFPTNWHKESLGITGPKDPTVEELEEAFESIREDLEENNE